MCVGEVQFSFFVDFYIVAPLNNPCGHIGDKVQVGQVIAVKLFPLRVLYIELRPPRYGNKPVRFSGKTSIQQRFAADSGNKLSTENSAGFPGAFM
jgi:hypothetical protein